MFDPNSDVTSLFGNNQNQEADDDLDLTNLIDMFSMLCVFLMFLISPLASISSALTEMNAAPLPNAGEASIVIRLTGDETVLLNEQSIELPHLAARLDALHKTTPAAAVQLAADENARYGTSLKIRAILKHLGIPCQEIGRLVQE